MKHLLLRIRAFMLEAQIATSQGIINDHTRRIEARKKEVAAMFTAWQKVQRQIAQNKRPQDLISEATE